MSLKKICASVKKYNNFLITAHTSPEGDAIGAELGFYNLIKKLGKRGTIVNEDGLPYGYDFMPGSKIIRRLAKGDKDIDTFAPQYAGLSINPKQTTAFRPRYRRIDFACFVVLDCSDLKRTGEVYKLNKNHKLVLNIDHHISNRIFGDVNWVDPNASSCSEMVYKLYKQLRLPMDKDTALALYTGMMTDTGSFRYSNTSSFTHQAVSELLKSGINVAQVYRDTYENIPLSEIKLLLKLLVKIEFYCQGKVAGFKITRDLFKGRRPCIDLADFVLSFGRAIKGVEVVVVFKENFKSNKEVRVNLRSQGKVDVNKIASLFGGGGHKTAAGCTLHGEIAQVSRKLLAGIREYLK